MFGKGISREGDILDLAANLGIVNKSGAWYAYNDAKIGQGRENAKLYLKEHPDVMAEIETAVREHLWPPGRCSGDSGGQPRRRKAARKLRRTSLTERQKNDCDRNRELRKRKNERSIWTDSPPLCFTEVSCPAVI